MSRRKALLIAAEEYGEGFARLPAVREDLRLLSTALEACGYEIETCPDDVTRDAIELDDTIRDFAADGGPDDVRLIYFTGHGVLVDDDCIVPAATARDAAVASGNHRVSTDLSKTVAASDTGLVLFVVDACRSAEDVVVAKGASGWGDAACVARPDETRFLRLFGCASNEICQVVPGDQPSSLFTRALAESLMSGAASLREVIDDVGKRCAALLAKNIALQSQRPHLSYGELSADKDAVLARRIFDRSGDAALKSIWAAFEPDKLHCALITSESGEQSGDAPGLYRLVRNALSAKNGKKVWDAFAATCHGRKLLSGKMRDLSREFGKSSVAFGAFSVAEAFLSAETLDKAARAVVEADLAIFDVTGFDPGVMVLIGIRSACRRGVTICTHGAAWREGRPLEVPFNLQDLSIGSHTAGEAKAGPNPVLDRLLRRIEAGFQQLERHPRYLDLPAYDALRELGSEYDASSIIPLRERVLVLCSYDDDLFANWELVASELQNQLWEKAELSPSIERIIDYGSPQLIWQSLYEVIRRAAACVVDWSDFSASVFLELGVRLAASEWGAVHLVDVRYLPGGPKQRPLKHVDAMFRLFSPVSYRTADPADAFAMLAELLLARQPDIDAGAVYNRVHRTLLPVIGVVHEAHLPLFVELQRRADALHHPQQERKAAPQILFHGNRPMKEDSESAALELRIAAWLYLEHRVGMEKMKSDAARIDLFRTLGRAASAALYDRGDDESIMLASYIDERLARLE
jgi:hypothetical protein